MSWFSKVTTKKTLALAVMMVADLLLGCSANAGATEHRSGAEGEPVTLSQTGAAMPVDLSVSQVKSMQGTPGVMVIDVREPFEYEQRHIPGTVHIPMGQVMSHKSALAKAKTLIVACRSGHRSSQVVRMLQADGFTNVHNMVGGINAWRQAGYSVER